jgi:hypothetical protein
MKTNCIVIRKSFFNQIGLLLAAVLLVAALLPAGEALSSVPIDLGAPVSTESLGALPLSFVPNRGQTAPEVDFHVRGVMGGEMFFTSRGLTLALPTPTDSGAETDLPELSSVEDIDIPPPTVVELHFVGANTEPTITPGERQEGVVNYFIGNDPDQWVTNIPTHSSIT